VPIQGSNHLFRGRPVSEKRARVDVKEASAEDDEDRNRKEMNAKMHHQHPPFSAGNFFKRPGALVTRMDILGCGASSWERIQQSRI